MKNNVRSPLGISVELFVQCCACKRNTSFYVYLCDRDVLWCVYSSEGMQTPGKEAMCFSTTFLYKWLKWLSREALKVKNYRNVIHSLRNVCVCVHMLFFFCCPSVLGRLGAILCETWVFSCFTSPWAQVEYHKQQWPNFIGFHPICPNDLKWMQGDPLVFLGSCRYFAHMSKNICSFWHPCCSLEPHDSPVVSQPLSSARP